MSAEISPHDPVVGVRELNQHTRRVLDVVRGGETVIVTDRGRPVARIVPVDLSPFERLVAEGEYVPASTTRIHTPSVTLSGGRSAAETLDDVRAERL